MRRVAPRVSPMMKPCFGGEVTVVDEVVGVAFDGNDVDDVFGVGDEAVGKETNADAPLQLDKDKTNNNSFDMAPIVRMIFIAGEDDIAL